MHSFTQCTSPEMDGEKMTGIFASSTSQITPLPVREGPRRDGKQRDMTCDCALCVYSHMFFHERPLEAGRRPLSLCFPKLLFSLLPFLRLCCKTPNSPSRPSVTQHPADQTPHRSSGISIFPFSLLSTSDRQYGGSHTQTVP